MAAAVNIMYVAAVNMYIVAAVNIDCTHGSGSEHHICSGGEHVHCSNYEQQLYLCIMAAAVNIYVAAVYMYIEAAVNINCT